MAMRQGVQQIIVQEPALQTPATALMAVQSQPSGERFFAAISILLVLAVVISHVVWLSRVRCPMLWDDSMYAAGALEIYDGLADNGLPGLLQRFIRDSSAA